MSGCGQQKSEKKTEDKVAAYNFNPKGNLLMRANFTKLYDSEGNLLKDKAAKFDEMYIKYGSKKSLSL